MKNEKPWYVPFKDVEYTDTLFDTLHDWVDTLQINESR